MKGLRVFSLVVVVLGIYSLTMVSDICAADAIQTQDANLPDLVVQLTGLQIRQDMLTLKFRFTN